MDVPTSTRDGVEERESAVGVWGRRAVLTGIVAIVIAGLSGVLGVHTSVATRDEDGYRLSLTYATVARSGLDVPWTLTVQSDHGFSDTITLAVTADYFDIFETQGFFPDPSSSVRNGDMLYLTFDSPGGDTFVVSYDAYIQPASQRGRSGSVGLVEDGGHTVADVSFRTRLLP